MVLLFEAFLALHILCGTVGLVTFWIGVGSAKGGDAHRRYGTLFARTIFVTGLCAIGMSLISLGWPLETHPKLLDAALVRGLFGWMMLYLAILTVGLVWHGVMSVRRKAEHGAHRAGWTIGIQLATILAAVNCAAQGYLIGQPLMIGMATIGVASGGTNLWFIFTEKPWRLQYVVEHFKALVGAGISVYTAFFAFGAVRFMPSQAFAAWLWALPLSIGLGIIIHHWLKYRRIAARTRGVSRPSAAASGT
jgi:hypothetical protein